MDQVTVLLLFIALITHTSSSQVSSLRSVQYSLLEESPPDTIIGDFMKDYRLIRRYDQPTLATLRFSVLLQPNSNTLFFAVDERTGVISSTRRIDRETVCPESNTCTLNFKISVSPAYLFDLVNVTINLQDINDNSPTFPEIRLYHALSEDAEIGTGFDVPTAVDPDSDTNGLQRYEIFPANGKFELQIDKSRQDGESNLKLILREPLDREVEERYQINVYAIDGGNPPKTGVLIVDIAIQDVNDNSPVFEQSTYSVSVHENIPIGAALIRVKATDKDLGANAVVTYGFSSFTEQLEGDLLGIEPDTGKIFLKRMLDYETNHIILLSVLARDQGPDTLPSSAVVVVRVLDLNDNAPIIRLYFLTTESHASVVKHSSLGTFVAHVVVMDEDSGMNGRTQCSIDDNLFNLQQIYQTEYQLTTATDFDRDAMASYDVVITCKDNGYPPLTAEATLKVYITEAESNDTNIAI